MTARGAAFVDLDRTLIRGASGRILSEALRTEGVLTGPVPGERLLFGLFEAFGENLPSMALARHAALLARGRSRAATTRAAQAAVPGLLAEVRPGMLAVVEQHRALGRPVVLATTTPADLIEPFAKDLGLEHVIATRFGLSGDGTYEGSIDGHFVWSVGKLAAVREWAEEHGVDLGESYAYSDSVFDAPLLCAVGHPCVVSPDPRMRLVALARGWPTLRFGRNADRVVNALTKPALFPSVHWDIDGVDRIPDDGPFILVANYCSWFDAVAVAVMLAQAGRAARFLADETLFGGHVAGRIARVFGCIRTDRGSDDLPDEAVALLREGGAVVLLSDADAGTVRGAAGPPPTGTHAAARLAARLAALTRAPVLPVGMRGTGRVWPNGALLPSMLGVLRPTAVGIRVGDCVPLKYRSVDADTRRVAAALGLERDAVAACTRAALDERHAPRGFRP